MQEKNQANKGQLVDENINEKIYNNFSELLDFIKKKSFALSDEQVSSRAMVNWIDQGIVDDPRDTKTGKYWFSMVDLVWINLVIKLREFNQKLYKIKHIKKELSFLNEKCLIGNIPILDFYILYSFPLKKQDPLFLVLFESCEILFVTESDFHQAVKSNIIQQDYIKINFTQLVERVYERKEIDLKILKDNDSVNDLVNQAINSANFNRISIENKQNEFLINTEYFIEDKRKADKLINELCYAELIIKRNAGVNKYFITQKTKFLKT